MKEKFFYLEQKYDVRLIVNNELGIWWSDKYQDYDKGRLGFI